MSLFDDASLVLIPDGAKDGTLYTVKPTDGTGDFTFTRGSNLAATRVDENGLIEKGRENLLLRSNSFNATWVTYLTSLTSGQSGYDGTSDAWLIEKSGAFGNVYQNLSSSGVRAFSVYAKAGSYDFLALRFRNTSNNYRTAYFDLSNGTLGSVHSNIIKHTIEDIGSGWYRCQIAFNDSAVNQVLIYPSDVNNGIGNSGTGNIYIQDAQLEQGLVATDYIETITTTAQAGILEDLPRIDYSGGASCPALLLEPQRTNGVSHSEYFGGYTLSNLTLEHNATISPEGLQNATRLIENTAAGAAHNVGTAISTIATEYSFSVYAKPNGRDFIYMYVGAGPAQGIIFDIANGTIGSNIANAPNDSFIEPVGDGWYRCTMLFTGVAGTPTPAVGLANSSSSFIYTGDGTSGVYLYGAQIEAGSYPTSYIPTYGTSVTRSLDDVNELTGVSDLIGQTEGTLFLDFVANDDDVLQIIYQVRTTGSTNVGQIDFRIQSGNLRALGNDAGTAQFNISAGAAVPGTRYKCAVRYANNDVVFYVNGVLKGSDTSASFSSSALQQISFSENTGSYFPSASIKQALLFPTALTNTELAALTTL